MTGEIHGERLFAELINEPVAASTPEVGDLCEFRQGYVETDPENHHALIAVHYEYSYEAILEILPETDDDPAGYATDTKPRWPTCDLVRVVMKARPPGSA